MFLCHALKLSQFNSIHGKYLGVVYSLYNIHVDVKLVNTERIMSSRIIVKNLPNVVTAERLTEHFSKLGQVGECNVVNYLIISLHWTLVH